MLTCVLDLISKIPKKQYSINAAIEDFKQVNVVINLLEIFDGGFVHLSENQTNLNQRRAVNNHMTISLKQIT